MQKNIIWVLGMVGGLAVIVPNLVPSPQGSSGAENQAVEASSKSKSKPSPASLEEDNTPVDDNIPVDEAEISDFDDSDVDASNFGQPTAFGESGNEDESATSPSKETLSQPSIAKPSEDSAPPSERPAALVSAGLENGSGGKINVTQEDIDNAREY